MLDRVVFARGWRVGDEVDDAADDFRRQRRNDVVILRAIVFDAAQLELRLGHDEKNRRLVRQEFRHFDVAISFDGLAPRDRSDSFVIGHLFGIFRWF